MKYALLLLAMVAAVIVISCNEKSVPTDTDGNTGSGNNGGGGDTGGGGGGATIDTAGKLFVSQGASGNGTISSPFGSIRQALEVADQTPHIDTILLSSGTFEESLDIGIDVYFSGNRDPLKDWRESDSKSLATIISSPKEDSTTIVVRGECRVTFRALEILGPDSATSGSSATSIVASNAELHFSNCTVVGGDGSRGASGLNGVSGSVRFATLPSQDLIIPRGGRGGSPKWRDCDFVLHNGSPGERGWAADGTQTGGLGSQSGPGEKGADGASGNNGRGAGTSTTFKTHFAVTVPVINSGEDGGVGISGSGAGGAGATYSPHPQCGNLVPHCPCSDEHQPCNGGRGGPGGEGGKGGIGGASSYAFALSGVQLILDSCTISGGRGGDGGVGGYGGVGMDGFESVCIGSFVGPVSSPGGAGGTGGNGGGGAGGWSIGILSINSTIVKDAATTITHGTPGKGGIGPTPESTGADGKAVTILEI